MFWNHTIDKILESVDAPGLENFNKNLSRFSIKTSYSSWTSTDNEGIVLVLLKYTTTEYGNYTNVNSTSGYAIVGNKLFKSESHTHS